MKKTLLSLMLASLTFAGFSTTWTVVNSGFSFSPANLTVTQGDTVLFALASNHNSVEVSQSIWNAGGNTSNGGFSMPFGGGQLLTATLTPGNHWYVCQPHAFMGMKGTINVQIPTGLSDITENAAASFPNVFTNDIVIKNPTGADAIEVYNLLGNRVYFTATGADGQIELNGDLFARGAYLYRLTKNGKAIQTNRFVKL